jgi:alpha-1,2-mannosyltransferase
VGRTARQVTVLVVLAAAAFALLAAFATRHGYFDLKVYYGAINFWAHRHGEIYDYLKPLTKYGFTYPPFAALTMLPMTVLPWPVVIVISVAATTLVTVLIIYWFLRPVIEKYRWTPWFAVAVAAVFAAVFEPLRETVNFGQVNMLLVFLVVADLIVLVYPGRRWGGVGIGLATAIKLTPGVFILYLLLARRFRATGVAIGTAALTTVLAAVVAPHASQIFWTYAVFDTDRVGSLSYISNQSLEGFVARLDPARPNMILWAGLVVAALLLWAWRTRRAVRLGDDRAGLALTGIMGCLVSPVTWVHHLVWLLPAMLLLTARGLLAGGSRRIRLLIFAGALYALLSSKLVWQFADSFTGWGLLFSNAYVLASVALLALLPLSPAASHAPAPAGPRAADLRSPDPRSAGPALPGPDSAGPGAGALGVADLGQLDDAAAGPGHRVHSVQAVGPEAEIRVEPPGGVVRLQHP